MIFDFRVRPPYKIFMEDSLFDTNYICEFSKSFGSSFSLSGQKRSMEIFLQEMEESGITKALVPVRRVNSTYKNTKEFGDNEDVLELLKEYPGRFVAVAGVKSNGDAETLAEVDKYVAKDKCAGIIIEPGMGEQPIEADDEAIFPLYEKCEKEQIPVLITFSGFAFPKLDSANPSHIDHIAEIFPKLKIAVVHGAWPWVVPMCSVAFNRKEVYISPDTYVPTSAGADDYVKAANYMLRKRIVYGSSYPIVKMQDAVNGWLNCGFKDDVLPDIMYHNAMNYFGLEK